MALTEHGRIIVGGSSRTATGTWNVWLQRLDRSGAVQSDNEYEAAAPLAELVTEHDSIYALTSTAVVRGSATPWSRIVAIQPAQRTHPECPASFFFNRSYRIIAEAGRFI